MIGLMTNRSRRLVRRASTRNNLLRKEKEEREAAKERNVVKPQLRNFTFMDEEAESDRESTRKNSLVTSTSLPSNVGQASQSARRFSTGRLHVAAVASSYNISVYESRGIDSRDLSPDLKKLPANQSVEESSSSKKVLNKNKPITQSAPGCVVAETHSESQTRFPLQQSPSQNEEVENSHNLTGQEPGTDSSQNTPTSNSRYAPLNNTLSDDETSKSIDVVNPSQSIEGTVCCDEGGVQRVSKVSETEGQKDNKKEIDKKKTLNRSRSCGVIVSVSYQWRMAETDNMGGSQSITATNPGVNQSIKEYGSDVSVSTTDTPNNSNGNQTKKSKKVSFSAENLIEEFPLDTENVAEVMESKTHPKRRFGRLFRSRSLLSFVGFSRRSEVSSKRCRENTIAEDSGNEVAFDDIICDLNTSENNDNTLASNKCEIDKDDSISEKGDSDTNRSDTKSYLRKDFNEEHCMSQSNNDNSKNLDGGAATNVTEDEHKTTTRQENKNDTADRDIAINTILGPESANTVTSPTGNEPGTSRQQCSFPPIVCTYLTGSLVTNADDPTHNNIGITLISNSTNTALAVLSETQSRSSDRLNGDQSDKMGKVISHETSFIQELSVHGPGNCDISGSKRPEDCGDLRPASEDKAQTEKGSPNSVSKTKSSGGFSFLKKAKRKIFHRDPKKQPHQSRESKQKGSRTKGLNVNTGVRESIAGGGKHDGEDISVFGTNIPIVTGQADARRDTSRKTPGSTSPYISQKSPVPKYSNSSPSKRKDDRRDTMLHANKEVGGKEKKEKRTTKASSRNNGSPLKKQTSSKTGASDSRGKTAEVQDSENRNKQESGSPADYSLKKTDLSYYNVLPPIVSQNISKGCNRPAQ